MYLYVALVSCNIDIHAVNILWPYLSGKVIHSQTNIAIGTIAMCLSAYHWKLN